MEPYLAYLMLARRWSGRGLAAARNASISSTKSATYTRPSFAFAAAGLTCAAHLHLPLYGSRSLDAATCAVSLGTATLTSLLRVVAGRHHLSDVIVGAILGFLAGWVLPAAANYGFRPGV